VADAASALLSRGRMRRAADGAPVVRQAADAWVNGESIQWDAVDALGRTDRERLLTRELRTLA
jgi:hypothetical protein